MPGDENSITALRNGDYAIPPETDRDPDVELKEEAQRQCQTAATIK